MGALTSQSLYSDISPPHFSRWAFVSKQYCTNWQMYVGHVWDWSLDVFSYRALLICELSHFPLNKRLVLKGKTESRSNDMSCVMCACVSQQLILSCFISIHPLLSLLLFKVFFFLISYKGHKHNFPPSRKHFKCCCCSVCGRLSPASQHWNIWSPDL